MVETKLQKGIPNNIKESDKLSQDELHFLATKYILKQYLNVNGFEIGEGFPRKEYPNIVCRRNGQLYGIVVVPSVFPDFVLMDNNFRLKTVELCKKQNTIALFAPVGFKSKDEVRADAKLTLKNDDYKIYFPGFVVLTDEKEQDLTKNFVRIGEN